MAMKVEIVLVACIQTHSKDLRFIKLGKKLEELQGRHERGLKSRNLCGETELWKTN